MYKGGKIIASLIIFVGLLTIPFFYNMGKANSGPEISFDTPAIQQSDGQCVESPEFMRANHMQLLNQWREEAVRNGQSEYINEQGKRFEISLQDTCLNCHSTEAEKVAKTEGMSNPALGTSNPAFGSPQFCTSCHDYNAVKPLCYSCHFEPKEAVK